MTTQFIPYGHQSINQEDIEEVTKALQSDIITRGEYVEAFEKALAKYCQAEYAVAFSNATTALMGAYQAANATSYDRVISTPNTYISTLSAATMKGAIPVFVDIDLTTGNFQIDQVQNTLEYRSTRGKNFIAPVHFSGIAVDMKRLMSTVKDPEVVVIEDAAHAIGSYYPDAKTKVGSCAFSDMTVFSFHPVKTMTTGEGGIVTTNQEELYQRLRLIRNMGVERDPQKLERKELTSPWYYEVQEVSGNYHMTDFQAALGLSQFKRLDQFITKRRKLVKLYRQLLKQMPHIRLFDEVHDPYTAYHLFVVQIDFKAYKTDRTRVMNQLKENGIGTQYHYIPVYAHPCYAHTFGDLSMYFPEMETYYQQALSLPLYYDLSEENVDFICQKLKQILVK